MNLITSLLSLSQSCHAAAQNYTAFNNITFDVLRPAGMCIENNVLPTKPSQSTVVITIACRVTAQHCTAYKTTINQLECAKRMYCKDAKQATKSDHHKLPCCC
jgi:hypothetical protein